MKTQNEVKIPNIRKLNSLDCYTMFENAICDTYGLDYPSDSANISMTDLWGIREEIKKTPYKFYYAEDAYEDILKELKEYVNQNLSDYNLTDTDISIEDLESILKYYSEETGLTLEAAVRCKLRECSAKDIYESCIKKDMPVLIEELRNAENTGVYHDKEQEILENFLEERNIRASAELIRKINKELRKELPDLPFIYARACVQFEKQLGRNPIVEETELEEER